jgi:hypothetical protein
MNRAVRHTIVALGVAATLVSIGGADTVALQNRERLDLSGTWTLDRDLSDKGSSSAPDPGGSEGGARRPPGDGTGASGGGMGRHGGGFGGRGDQHAAGPRPSEVERRQAAIEAARRVATTLVIIKSDAGLLVTDDEGVSIRIPLDGRKETGAANGVPFETIAKWEEARLRVQREFKGGLKVVDYYSLSSNPHLLLIASKLEGGGVPRLLRAVSRVYNQNVPAAAGRP